MSLRVLFSIAVWMLFVQGAGAGPDRYRFEAGAERSYRLTLEQTFTIDLMGAVNRRFDMLELETTWRVKNSDDETTATIMVTVDRVRARMERKDGKETYDSADQDAPEPAEELRPCAVLHGRTFDLEVGPDGQIGSVSGVEELRSAVLGTIEEQPGRRTSMRRDELETRFSEPGLAALFGAVLCPLKEETVGSYQAERAMLYDFPIITDCEWTSRESNAGVSRLTYRGTVGPHPVLVGARSRGGRLSFDVEGRCQGQYDLDERTGWTERARGEHVATGMMGFTNLPEQFELPDSRVKYEGAFVVERLLGNLL